MPDQFILTLSCPDRAGIVHAVTGALLGHDGNITEAAQYDDPSTGLWRISANVRDIRCGASKHTTAVSGSP